MSSASAAARSAARRVVPPRTRRYLRRRFGKIENPRGRWSAEADGRPDRWPDEFVVAPPEFIGVGAQRSGSTWWFRMINEHPDVFHHEKLAKEVRYLMRFYTTDPTDADVAEYATWFPRPPGKVAGEWTPIYLAYPWMSGLLQRCAPDAKILVILRDPLERFVSGLGLTQPNLNSAAALRQAGIGFYASQLEPIEAHIAPANLLVLQYEQCRDDPETQLARTFEFLGLDPFVVSADVLRSRTGTAYEKPPLSAERRRQLVEAYAPDVDALLARYPGFDPSLWRNFR